MRREHVAAVVEVRLRTWCASAPGSRPCSSARRARRSCRWRRANRPRTRGRSVRRRRSHRRPATTTSRSTRCTSTSLPVAVGHHEVLRRRVERLRRVEAVRVHRRSVAVDVEVVDREIEVVVVAGLFAEQRVDTPTTVDPRDDPGRVEEIEHVQHVGRGHHRRHCRRSAPSVGMFATARSISPESGVTASTSATRRA